MPYAPADAHVRLDLHPTHAPAVVATTSGATSDAARSHLHDLGFRSTGPSTMVLARIDREEPYYANAAAGQLRQLGYTVEVTPELQEEMDAEWTWPDYPLPGCSREDIREVSATAQRLHDDISSGRLLIHLHAHEGPATVAVATYTSGIRRSFHLHGENHLRQISNAYADEAEAVADFHRLHSVAVRPGPPPLTDVEKSVSKLLTSSVQTGASDQDEAPAEIATKMPPVPTAGPGEHEQFLNTFLEANTDWERYRTWSDETTIVNHESLALRAEFDHEARHRTDTAWTIAAYESPVGERRWHSTITATAPVTFVRSLMEGLTDAPWSSAEAPSSPLREAGWTEDHSSRTTWRAPDLSLAFEHNPHGVDDRWTAYGGADPNHPAWAIRLSATTAPEVLARLTTKLIDATALGRDRSRGRETPTPVSPLPRPVGHPQSVAHHR